MRLRSLTALAALVGLGLGMTWLPASPEDAGAAQFRVIDGDTVEMSHRDGTREKMRLLDVDAPELHGARCPAEKIQALVATNLLRTFLRSGPVTVERRGRDRYGRTLVHLRTAAGDAGAHLLSSGSAVRWSPGRAAWQERAAHWCGN